MTGDRPSQNKLYGIAEVAEELGVQPHVLRYWESRFPQHVRPLRDKGGVRRYRRRDVEALRTIKTLLYERGYTIAGAKQVMGGPGKGGSAEEPAAGGAAGDLVADLRRGLEELKDLLRSGTATG